jgi:Ca-activated chloride channel homolog
LLGYENRKLNKEDFNDDKKDAGEIGAGHTVTALYEIVPANSAEELSRPKVDDLRYQPKAAQIADVVNNEMLVIKTRYKKPDGQKSILEKLPVACTVLDWNECDNDFRFASAVAAFGMTLRNSKFAGNTDYDKIISWAQNAKGADKFAYRKEFISLVRTAKSISNK